MNIPSDKKQHFCACGLIGAMTSLFGIAMSISPLPCLVFGFLCAMSCGIGKEYGDSKAAGNFWDWYDVLADGVGALTGSGIVSLLYWIFS